MQTLEALAKTVGGAVLGDAGTKISGITNADHPQPGFITYLTDAKKLEALEVTDIAALIIPKNLATKSKPAIQVENPKLAWAMLLRTFFPPRTYPARISQQAAIDPGAVIGKDVRIEAFVHIGKNVRIGDGTVIRAHAYIDDDTTIGQRTIIHPNVTIYDHMVIGNHVIIHAGCVIGTDGFGYVFNGKEHYKVSQIGNVVIEDGVEIGGNVTIDRATMGSTVIKAGSKIDNLVQIAHNVSFGPHSVASALTGISGSSKVGAYVTLAGQVGVGDHVDIGNAVIIGAQAGLPTGKKVPDRAILIGSPARPAGDMKKQVAAQLRLSETTETVRDLKKRIAKLEGKPEETKKI